MKYYEALIQKRKDIMKENKKLFSEKTNNDRQLEYVVRLQGYQNERDVVRAKLEDLRPKNLWKRLTNLNGIEIRQLEQRVAKLERDCGNTLVGRQSNNWGSKVYEYSDRKNTAGAHNRGCGFRVKCNQIDVEVWNTVLSWLNQPDEIAAAYTEDIREPYEKVEIVRIEKELDKIKTSKKRLVKLFATIDDGLGEETVREELRELSVKEERLNEQLIDLNNKLSVTNPMEFSHNLLQEAIEYYLSKSTDELTFDDKKSIIRQVVREVQVYKDRIDIYSF